MIRLIDVRQKNMNLANSLSLSCKLFSAKFYNTSFFAKKHRLSQYRGMPVFLYIKHKENFEGGNLYEHKKV